MDSLQGRFSSDAPEHRSNDRLDSWGEIATYLRRGIRTVRRWESQEGLPVHRHLHRKSGSVYAFKSEVDAWWNNRCPPPDSSKENLPSRWTLQNLWAIGIVLIIGLGVMIWVKPLSSGRDRPHSSIGALAVLPFEDLSVNSEHDILADAMTEELITSLAQVMPMRITSRNSVMRYKHSNKSLREIAQELNVDGLVTGSVERAGQRVIITIRLVDARKDRHIWAGSFEGVPKNILEFQENTSHTAANEVWAALKPNPE